MQKFGHLRWPNTPLAMEAEPIRTPVGKTCGRCEEPIGDDDAGYTMPHISSTESATVMALHEECFIRQSVGSFAHQTKQCGCYDPVSTEGDPPALTKREGARLAMWAFGQLQRGTTSLLDE